MIRYNYHTHTKRCGHASGEDEEYVLNAISSNYLELGFSDHVFLPGITQKGIRGDYSELEGYLSSIYSLKNKYKDQIKIYCGLECEYFDQFENYYRSLLEEKKVEFLILGQHFYFADGGELKSCSWYVKDIEEAENKYVDLLIKGMSTGLFKYVCHPDVYCLIEDEWTPMFEKMAHRICQAAIKYNMPLEINLCATRNPDRSTWKYPNDRFWEIAGSYGVRVVVGIDAHQPDRFVKTCYDRAFELIEKYNLKYEEKINID